MNSHIAGAIAAAAIALAAPAAASAADEPIQVDHVAVSPASDFSNNFAYPGIVDVSFTNTNPTAATDVVFAVRGYKGRYIDEINDVGNFAPGQTIRHSFNGVLTGSPQEPNLTVEVEKATFADGTTWTPSLPSAPVLRRQSSY
jgi:hypothetical protein